MFPAVKRRVTAGPKWLCEAGFALIDENSDLLSLLCDIRLLVLLAARQIQPLERFATIASISATSAVSGSPVLKFRSYSDPVVFSDANTFSGHLNPAVSLAFGLRDAERFVMVCLCCQKVTCNLESPGPGRCTGVAFGRIYFFRPSFVEEMEVCNSDTRCHAADWTSGILGDCCRRGSLWHSARDHAEGASGS